MIVRPSWSLRALDQSSDVDIGVPITVFNIARSPRQDASQPCLQTNNLLRPLMQRHTISGQTRRAFLRLTAAGLLALSSPVLADQYPSRPVRLIVPFPPGGSNDVVGRLVAGQLSERLGQQVFVDNRGGAGGVIGTEAAANAAADGYTLLIVSIAHAVNPALYKLNYDPVRSFAPVTILATGPNVLAINPRLPVSSVKDLIRLAQQKPGELEYASAGIGTFQHLGGELFKLMAAVDILHVP